ncbi:MAG: endonuclease domain-containing protein [Actinomycetota bacterium]
MALCLWAGDSGAASHRAAARVLGFQGFGLMPPEISTTLDKKLRGYRVHRVDDRLLGEIDVVQGIPTTSAPRTLHDLAGLRHPRTERALDDALLKKLTTMARMWLYHDQEWTRGRRGIAILRNLLRDRTPGRAPTQSDLELMFRRIVKRYSLPLPEQQHPILLRNGELIHPDFAYPYAWLAIELDSYGWHMDREAFERDRARDLELQALGWRVLRFTWAMLKYKPDEVAATVKLHLGI